VGHEPDCQRVAQPNQPSYDPQTLEEVL